MKKYFKLFPFCKFYKDDMGGCIYDLFSGKMWEIGSKESQLLAKSEQNELIDNHEEFFEDLRQNVMGDFYDSPIKGEQLEPGIHPLAAEVYNRLILKRVYICLTSKCSMNCTFCKENMSRKTGCKHHMQREEVTLEQWKSFISKIKLLGCEKIIFTGGDPLIKFEDLKKLVQLCQSIEIKNIEIHTNGILINDDIIDFLKSYNISVNLQITEENLQTLEENKIIDKISNTKVCATVLVYPQNQKNLLNMLDIFKKYNIPVNTDLIYSEYKEDSNYLNLYLKHTNTLPSYIDPITFSCAKSYNNCFYGQIAVMPNGDILPCPMMDKYVLSNINKSDWRNQLKQGQYQSIIGMNKDKIDSCKKCSLRYGCLDCRAVAFSLTGQINGPSLCTRLVK